MGLYTHAFIESTTPDQGLTGAYETRIVYNTVKFHWKVKSNLISDIAYEASVFYFLEDSTDDVFNNDTQVLLKSILHNFEDFSTTRKVTCDLDTSDLEGTEALLPMIEGKRILCKNIKGLLTNKTYHISFKVAYSHSKWVEINGMMQEVNFGKMFIQGENTLYQKATYAYADLLEEEIGSTLAPLV